MQFNSFHLQKICFLTHFVLAILAMTSDMFGGGYLICQSYLIGIGLWWFIDQTNSRPLHLFSLVTLITIILDAIIIGSRWSSAYRIYQFSGAMAIILIILKPLMFLLTLKNARSIDLENGLDLPYFGAWGQGKEPGTQGQNFHTSFSSTPSQQAQQQYVPQQPLPPQYNFQSPQTSQHDAKYQEVQQQQQQQQQQQFQQQPVVDLLTGGYQQQQQPLNKIDY